MTLVIFFIHMCTTLFILLLLNLNPKIVSMLFSICILINCYLTPLEIFFKHFFASFQFFLIFRQKFPYGLLVGLQIHWDIQ